MSRKIFILSLLALFFFAAAAAPAVRAQVPDQVRRAIEEKARQLDLGSPQDDIHEFAPIPGGNRGFNRWYERGVLFFVQGHGVLLMSYAMRAAYHGDPFQRLSHRLGLPISNEFRCLTPDPRDRYQLFEHGTIFWRAADNQYVVEQGAPRPVTPGDCPHRPGPTATVVTGPEVSAGQKPPQRHRYRVTILGFTVNRQTFDGLQELDGKGDEVYLAVQVTKFQANGAMISNTGGRGVLMGDTNLRPANEERMTLGNLSPDGGIGNGFHYLPAQNPRARYSLPTLPWVVYEGELTQGFDALTIIPSIWEWDDYDSNFSIYQDVSFGLRRAGTPFFFYPRPDNRRTGIPEHASPVESGWITQLVSESVRSPNGIPPTSTWGGWPIVSFPNHPISMFIPNGDRPIGLHPGPKFVPQIMFLTEPLAQRTVTMNFPLPAVSSSSGNTGITVEEFRRLGPGVIPVRYSGTEEGTGDYTLFVKVEQIP
jgi:LGFP repeat